MSGMTIEDGVRNTGNRFDMVLMAAHRSRLLAAGADAVVKRNNDKNSVVALREIAASLLIFGDLREGVIHSLQKQVEFDEPDAEAAPAAFGGESIVQPNTSAGTPFRRMTEKELLRGLDALVAPPPHDEEE